MSMSITQMTRWLLCRWLEHRPVRYATAQLRHRYAQDGTVLSTDQLTGVWCRRCGKELSQEWEATPCR